LYSLLMASMLAQALCDADVGILVRPGTDIVPRSRRLEVR
jgi:hypothetical protein